MLVHNSNSNCESKACGLHLYKVEQNHVTESARCLQLSSCMVETCSRHATRWPCLMLIAGDLLSW